MNERQTNTLRAVLQEYGFKIDGEASQEWYGFGELQMSFVAFQQIIDNYVKKL